MPRLGFCTEMDFRRAIPWNPIERKRVSGYSQRGWPRHHPAWRWVGMERCPSTRAVPHCPFWARHHLLFLWTRNFEVKLGKFQAACSLPQKFMFLMRFWDGVIDPPPPGFPDNP
eukprot:EG_transcript_40380